MLRKLFPLYLLMVSCYFGYSDEITPFKDHSINGIPSDIDNTIYTDASEVSTEYPETETSLNEDIFVAEDTSREIDVGLADSKGDVIDAPIDAMNDIAIDATTDVVVDSGLIDANVRDSDI